jgi:hypothetical protein
MRAVVALLTGLLAAPLAAPAAAQDQGGDAKRRPNVITSAEIDSIREQADNAMTVIRRLRPQFLRARGPNSFGNARGGRTMPYPRVIIDGMPRGELDALHQVSAMALREVRFLNAADASTLYGTGYDGGAIVVLTR